MPSWPGCSGCCFRYAGAQTPASVCAAPISFGGVRVRVSQLLLLLLLLLLIIIIIPGGAASETPAPSPTPPYSNLWAGRTVYMVMTDRFARDDPPAPAAGGAAAPSAQSCPGSITSSAWASTRSGSPPSSSRSPG